MHHGAATSRSTGTTKLEKVLERVRLVNRRKMEASAKDFFRRVPGKAPYPTGREKDLYAEFAHILLSEPATVIPALIHALGAPATLDIERRLAGTWRAYRVTAWRAYRVTTVRRDRGTHWKAPHCFPGCAGEGAISDVVLLLNPSFHGGEQVNADLLLYFELKSSDKRRQDREQIDSHLSALAAKAPSNGFLGAVGGRPLQVTHPQWLGHVSLSTFLEVSERATTGKSQLSADIRKLRQRLQSNNALR